MELPRPKIIAESWITSHEYRILRDTCHVRHLSVVFVNGCFDLLHSGHIAMLHHTAREYARVAYWNTPGPFVVGLNSDYSITKLKGAGRPVLNWAERARVLAGLGVVDAVIGFDEADASCLIRDLQPKFYGKGDDYAGKTFPELSALPRDALVSYCPRDTVDPSTAVSSSHIIQAVIAAETVRANSIPGPRAAPQAAARPLAGAGDQADRP